jgi:CHAT domain-containing protein
LAAVEDVSRCLEGLRFQVARALARGLPTGAKGARLAADAAAELAGLSGLLMDPLRAGLSGVEFLAVAPTGMLDAVPFPALSAGGLRLLDLPGFGVVPSASVLARLPAAREGPALVVGFGDAAAPRADAEAHEVAAAMSGATVLTGLAATRRAFQGMAAGRAHIHFAGHARFIPTNPGASGLKLADGWLTAADLSRLDLSGASVMLSGCDTGRAASAGGDERAGLARAVLSAGAASVTTTLWPVHDAGTRGLMARAYAMVYGREGDRGSGTRVIGRCLRVCQRELLEAGVHAAAWAPFVTVCCPWPD